MYNPLKLQSPVILPPESISQNWISKENFDLKENLTFSFKLKSSNTSDKELGFSIFLVNSSNTESFGASTIRSGLTDYSTKGEIGEGFNKNNEKLSLRYNNIQYDFLLNHVYPYSINGLASNQKPFNTEGFQNNNIFSILFDSTKEFYKNQLDFYKNVYFDEVQVKDIVTDQIVDPSTYNCPIFIQALQDLYVAEFKTDQNFDILNLNSVTIRFSFENYGKLFRMDVLEANGTEYKNVCLKYFDLNMRQYRNLKLGYGIASPIMTYNTENIADFTIDTFHIQGKLRE